MNAIFGWKNLVTTGTLTADYAAGGMPVTNLANDQGSADQGWQTPDGYGGANVTIDSGSEDSIWRAFLLARTNLSPGTVFGVTISNNADMSAPVASSGAVSGFIAGVGQCLYVAPHDIAGRYCRLGFNDPANPDGFANIALAYAGPIWQPSVNISWNSARGRTDQSSVVQTRGGQQYPQLQSSQRRYEIDFDLLPDTEQDQLGALDYFSRTGGNVLFVPDPASARVNRETIFGIMTPKADTTFSAPDRLAWKGSISERL